MTKKKNSGLVVLGMMLILAGVTAMNLFGRAPLGYLLTGLFLGAGVTIEIGALVSSRRRGAF